MQDTPGLASRQVVEAICKHAAAQDQNYLKHDQDPRRHWLMADREDAHIDVCLMFLNPHVIEAKEVSLMQGMCKLGVPVIPVIAKVRLYTSVCTLITQLDQVSTPSKSSTYLECSLTLNRTTSSYSIYTTLTGSTACR